MRRTTLAFLTFLAVMPSLVCFMAFCPMQSAQASEPVPCHEKSADSEDGGVMLVSDCMGVDFFMQDATNNFEIDQQIDTLDFAWADITATYNFEPQNINGIRGPPPSADVTSPSRPLYLTTGRFRI
jgi:hypothetical protein